ncbi:hypothetical protein D3C78_1275630 [compost metagenome]
MLLHPVGPGLEEPGRLAVAIAQAAQQQTAILVPADAAQHLAGIPRALPARQNASGGLVSQRGRSDLIVITREKISPQFGPVALGVGVGGDHHLLGQHRTLGSLHRPALALAFQARHR